MSANNNNKRVRRAIVEILFKHGACTREQVAEHLQTYKGVKNVPSANSISALMSKNPQCVIVGRQKVEMTNGINTHHMMFDIDREVIKTKDDLIFTRPISVMTPSEKQKAIQCRKCGRTRIMPTDEAKCLSCIRK
tara:strand:- start:4916 stop:5320 length:405 start_codon:yes stop_codon:yes gene_type:complete